MKTTKDQLEKAIILIKNDEDDCGCSPSYAGWHYHAWDLRYVDKRGIAHLNRFARRVAKVFRRDKRGAFMRPASERAKARLLLKRWIECEVYKGVREFVDAF